MRKWNFEMNNANTSKILSSQISDKWKFCTKKLLLVIYNYKLDILVNISLKFFSNKKRELNFDKKIVCLN